MNEIVRIKTKNVLDMALTFAAMNRVFEGESKGKIAQRLEMAFGELAAVRNKGSFDEVHQSFCQWFIRNIKTAEKKNKEGLTIKPSQATSYGHGAKVFDVASKVYVYYCHLPDGETAAMLLPFLHSAIDTAMMGALKSRYPRSGIKATNIGEIDEDEYATFQDLVARHMEDQFKDISPHPAQYDDIVWYRLNR